MIFGFQHETLKVLVPKLDFIGDFWALPSGFVFQHENLDQAARRILEHRTGIKDFYLDQFRVFGDINRNSKEFYSRMMALNEESLESDIIKRKTELEWITRRFVAVGYIALVDMHKVRPEKNEIDQSIEWYDIAHLPSLIMDHNKITQEAINALRINLDEKRLAFQLLPEKFTMKEVQQVYESVFDRPFARNNFQKKILEMEVLERLKKKFTGAANKAPFLYRVAPDRVPVPFET